MAEVQKIMTAVLTESVIYSKTPQEITTLLYEACIVEVEHAIEEIENKEFASANKRLQKTNDIIYRLGAGLNYEAGIIADQLDALYNYLADQIIEANLKKDVQRLKHVLETLESIAGAWNQALNSKKNMTNPSFKTRNLAYEQNSSTGNISNEIDTGK